MSATTVDIVPAGQPGFVSLHGADAETTAVWAFLARYRNDRTRNDYKMDLEQYARWCRTDAGLPHMLAAQRMHAELYVSHLQRKRLADATVARRVSTVRSFYKYCVIDEVIDKDPTIHLSTPKVDHDMQRRTWLTTLQFARLLQYSRQDPRSHAMVVSLGMLGLRVAEMCSLDVTDVRRLIGSAQITFIGKGGKQATIDLPLEVLTAYDTYAEGRDVGPLFLTRDWQRRWTPADVRRHLRTLMDRSGMPDIDITPHGLRRTAARTLQERGVELGAIQQFLRHKDPRTTSNCYIGDDSGAASLARQTLAVVYGNTAR